MLANLVIAKKAAAATAAAEAKARKEKAKNKSKNQDQDQDQDQTSKPGPDGGQPEAKHADANRLADDDEWKGYRGEWERERGVEVEARGTGGQDEPGRRR